MNRIIYRLSLIAIAIMGLTNCKKEKIDIVNKNFNLELRQPQGTVVPRVGEQISFQLRITGFDQESNKGEIETFFYVRNEQGESTGKFTTTDQKEIPIGKNYKYDYRKHNMTFDFLYTPTQDGDQELLIQVRCQGATKTVSFPLSLKTKSIIVTATGEGKIQHNGKIETSFSLLLKYGDTASFKALPRERHKFTGWYLDGNLLTNSLDYVLRAEKDVRIEARFKPMTYHIQPTINIPEAGSVATTTGRDTFEDGDLVEMRVTINEKHKHGYIFRGWYVDNQLVGDQLTYAFNAKDDVSPEARFEPKTFSFGHNNENSSRYSIRLDGNPGTRQTISYGKEYRLHLSAKFVSNSHIEDEQMIFELKNAEVNGVPKSSIHLYRNNRLEKEEFVIFTCRGEEHVRVRLISTRSGSHADSESEIYDRYID